MPESPAVPTRSTLRIIQAPISGELEAFQEHFRHAVRGKRGLLRTILRYVLKQKGKHIRPTLVLLAAKVCGEVTDATYRAATLVELLHTATLLHDDVVDEAESRRGTFSVNALWGNKAAVLVGDYFLSRGLLLALEHEDIRVLHIVSDAVRRMAEGELMQLKKARSMDLDEETYFTIISYKTASLLAACTKCGAASVSEDSDRVEQMQVIGEQLGLAFQIRDDLFDFMPRGAGKPAGLDLKKKLVTLPMIHALRQAEGEDRRQVLRILRRGGKGRDDRKAVLAFAEKHGGLDYAKTRMHDCISQAHAVLETFPESPSRTAMHALSEYIITRTR